MAKTHRPKTIREIQSQKVEGDKSTITINNVSKQMIPIHLNPPKGVDFYVGAQDIRLRPGQTHTLKLSRVRIKQVERLQKMGKIQVINKTQLESTEKVRVIKR